MITVSSSDKIRRQLQSRAVFGLPKALLIFLIGLQAEQQLVLTFILVISAKVFAKDFLSNIILAGKCAFENEAQINFNNLQITLNNETTMIESVRSVRLDHLTDVELACIQFKSASHTSTYLLSPEWAGELQRAFNNSTNHSKVA